MLSPARPFETIKADLDHLIRAVRVIMKVSGVACKP